MTLIKDNLNIRTTPPFKLKNKPGHLYQIINIKKQFGFIPEAIVIECVPQLKNTFVVHAVVTEKDLK